MNNVDGCAYLILAKREVADEELMFFHALRFMTDVFHETILSKFSETSGRLFFRVFSNRDFINVKTELVGHAYTMKVQLSPSQTAIEFNFDKSNFLIPSIYTLPAFCRTLAPMFQTAARKLYE